VLGGEHGGELRSFIGGWLGGAGRDTVARVGYTCMRVCVWVAHLRLRVSICAVRYEYAIKYIIIIIFVSAVPG